MWSAAEDLGMAAIAHVGFSRERIQFGWANNGSNDLTTYSLLSMVLAPQIGPQLLLGALVFDGVLERHPQLTVVVEEVGISWLPHCSACSTTRSDACRVNSWPTASSVPDFAGTAYKLPLAPSEYLRRQVTGDAARRQRTAASGTRSGAAGDAVLLERLSARRRHRVCRRDLRAAIGGYAPAVREAFYWGVGERIGL